MSTKKSKGKGKKSESVEEIAKTMVANMIANMENPEEFLQQKELIHQKAVDQVLVERKKREKESLTKTK